MDKLEIDETENPIVSRMIKNNFYSFRQFASEHDLTNLKDSECVSMSWDVLECPQNNKKRYRK